MLEYTGALMNAPAVTRKLSAILTLSAPAGRPNGRPGSPFTVELTPLKKNALASSPIWVFGIGDAERGLTPVRPKPPTKPVLEGWTVVGITPSGPGESAEFSIKFVVAVAPPTEAENSR